MRFSDDKIVLSKARIEKGGEGYEENRIIALSVVGFWYDVNGRL